APSAHAAGGLLLSIDLRYWPVMLSAVAATVSGEPAANIRPPPSPPSGPKSISQSHDLATSKLCSMTTTVLPLATTETSTFNSLATSSKCSPVVGSSNRYSVLPVSGRASSVANFNLCASPPLSVVE